jgi:hypothetical protein
MQFLLLKLQLRSQDLQCLRVVFVVLVVIAVLIVEEEGWRLIFSLLAVIVEARRSLHLLLFYLLLVMGWLYFRRMGCFLLSYRLFMLHFLCNSLRLLGGNWFLLYFLW